MNILYANPEKLIKLEGILECRTLNNEQKSLVPKENLEAFEIDGHVWKRINFKGDQQFVIVHIDGAIRDFSIFHIPFARITGDYQEEEFIQKLDEDPISGITFNLKYKKFMPAMVADYEELSKKVENGEKGYKGILNASKIVKEYNNWYVENH